jgi:hypothetical protein
MIIEGMEEQLVVRVRWVHVQGTSDRKAEKSRYPVLDHGAADSIDLVSGQHIEQGRGGDKLPRASPIGKQPLESRLHAAIDDHRVIGQRQ